MKSLFCLPLILLISLAIYGQEQPDLKREKLRGKVKTIELYWIDYNTVNGTPQPAARRLRYSNAYNPNGYYTGRTTYDPQGVVSSRYVYTFDERGRSTGYDEYPTINKKIFTVPRKHIYTLDEKNQRIGYKVVEADGSPGGSFVYRYDARGNQIENLWYTYLGVLGGRLSSAFDDNGNQLSRISYDPAGKELWKTTSTYFKADNKTESLNYENGVLRYKIVFIKNKKGRIIEKETTEYNAIPNFYRSHSPVPGKEIYVYDDRKQTNEVAKYKPDGSLISRTITTTDKRGNEIRYEIIASEGKLLKSLDGLRTTKYEYDSHGNWTKKTYLIYYAAENKSRISHQEERLISYYR